MTIDEQIEYMETEVKLYKNHVSGSTPSRNLGCCQAILTTLKEVKQAQENRSLVVQSHERW